MKKNRILFFIGLMMFISLTEAKAQTATDGFYMDKGVICVLADYSHDSWKEYWEGEKKRESNYIGTFNSSAINGMYGLGITGNLLFTGALPYIWTSSTEFYNSGQSGFQDLSLGLKWRIFRKHIAGGYISFQPSLTASFPVSDYIPDALPFSIGLHSNTLGTNGIVNYMMDKNFYLTINWGYLWRSNTTIDADSYWYQDQIYYTDEMYVPNLILYGARLGYDVERFRAEGWISVQNSQGGSDIRPNDKPYPCNRMSFTKVGVAGKYNLKQIANLSINASFGYTLDGRNTGQSTSYSAGVQYIFKCF